MQVRVVPVFHPLRAFLVRVSRAGQLQRHTAVPDASGITGETMSRALVGVENRQTVFVAPQPDDLLILKESRDLLTRFGVVTVPEPAEPLMMRQQHRRL